MRKWFQIVLVTALLSAGLSSVITISLPHIVPSWFGHQPVVAEQQPLRQVGGPPHTSGASNAAEESPLPKAETPPAEPWWAALLGRIAWPLALLGSLVLIAWNSRLRRLFGAGSRLVRKIKAGGMEMEISSEAVDEVRQQLRGSFRELVGSARVEYERMADLQDVDRRLSNLMDQEILVNLGATSSQNVRATVHVRDIVFKDYLYQFVNYYPKGGGAHRRFSQRYGIIGRSWRSRKSHGTGNAFGASASEESLIEEWGMTKDETHGILNSRPSCLSVLLRSGGIEVGILYIDSSDRDAFGDDRAAQAYATDLEAKPLVSELAASVAGALAPLRAAGPNLDLKELS